MSEFIFMLTHHDQTVPNAFAVYQEVKDTGLRHIGFKDIGLPFPDLKKPPLKMKRSDITCFYSKNRL
jgi:hypothetical protein